MNVTEMIAAACAGYHNDVAVISRERTITYGELDRESDHIAGFLEKNGVRPKDRVGIFLDRSTTCLSAMIGIWKAGGIYVPFDPEHPMERNKYILENSDTKLMITEKQYEELLADETCIYIDEIMKGLNGASESFKAVKAGEDAGAYILYTSGSTGKPKGVEISQGAVVNLLTSVARKPGMCREDKLLAITTFTFDISVLELFLPLILGARLYISGKEDVKDGTILADLIEENDISVMQATPTTWRMLLDAGWQGKKDLKILCGGEALSKNLAQELLGRCNELWNMYGPTETTIWSMIYRVVDSGHIYLGEPIDNTYIKVLSDDGKECGTGETGRLYIGGKGLFKGYFNNPGLTAEKLVSFSQNGENIQFYDTGDIVRISEDGNIEYRERADRQVKIRGFRIEPGEIEAAAEQNPFVKQAVAVVSDRDGDKKIILFFQEVKNSDCHISNLVKWLNTKIPSYMMPEMCVKVQSFPLTPNNKIDKKALSEQLTGSGEKQIRETDTDVFGTVMSLWESLLHMDDILPDDDFFDLGGHSLLVVQLLKKVKDIFGIRISNVEFLKGATTVDEMTEMIKQKLDKQSWGNGEWQIY